MPRQIRHDDKQQKGISSVETGISVLRIIEAASQPLALKDIAESAQLSTAATHHYLVSLIRTGLVRRNPATSHYELGQYSLQLGLTTLRRLDFVEIASETLLQIRDHTGESCFFAVWGSHGATIVKYLEGVHAIAVEIRLGLVLPLLGSATGPVFLTWLPDATLKPMLDHERSSADRTSAEQISQIKARVRKSGFSITQGGLLPRIAALSCPVFNHDGEIAGALTVLGWKGELDTSNRGTPIKVLLSQSQGMSARLGYKAEARKP